MFDDMHRTIPLCMVVLAVPAGLAAAHQVDLGDPRFAQLYTADDFALDPTDPRFKARTFTWSDGAMRIGCICLQLAAGVELR
jgi:NUC153 domain